MFNSVAKYLWGDSAEQGYQVSGEQTDAVEQHVDLDVRQDDDDWLVICQPDKENEGHSSPHPSHHHHHPHRHHHHHHHARPATVTDASETSTFTPIPHLPGASDIELLDEASSLERDLDLNTDSSPSGHGWANCPLDPLQDCTLNLNHFDLDSNYSSDGESGADSGVRPSSPESVFSACSGRSHATYRPSGSSRDPWIVAPPPCFTGSRAGELPTISSSPLENLLIEHPSMSVYLSLPPSSLPPSHPFHLAHLTGESMTASNEAMQDRDVARDHTQHPEQRSDQALTTVQPLTQQARREVLRRHRGFQAAEQISQMIAKVHTAQRAESSKHKKSLSRKKCRKENKVYELKGCPNDNTKRSKRNRPSGCKSGRMCQRV